MFTSVSRRFLNIFKNNYNPPKLGRWSLEHTESMVDRKADLTNEDHCGICDTMRLEYIEKKKELRGNTGVSNGSNVVKEVRL